MVDFAAPEDSVIELKENKKKRDKYLNLAKELKNIYKTWRWQWYQL